MYWLSFAEYCRERFGRRLYRAALDAHMTCPNRDGRISYGGCLFCSGSGSGEFAVSYNGQKLTRDDLLYNRQEVPDGDFIAYFQAYTNTYDSPDRLFRLFDSALADPLFAGISIATRPDCIPEEVMQVLITLKERYPGKFIWIELGLQTVHERTTRMIRRGYPLEVYDGCVKRLHENGFEVITHMIIGLPGETKEDILATAAHLNSVRTEGVKMHLLYYTDDSDLGKLYMQAPDDFHVLTKEEYVDILTECIAVLDPDIVLHRMTGDGDGEHLLAPLWSKDKRSVLNAVRHMMKVKGYVQGCRANEYI
ncbi:MAG: TIGR01212 family radical SAM protein [Solobacterium sp.]|nr:TIGR01212 family radical SAM protein [Solobacterium sp.]